MIKLGAKDALRQYTLEAQGEGIAWQRGPANPYAATVNTSNQFDTVDIWNEYTQEDWQTGVGRVDPLGGGFLYGEVESRVPNQLILPPLVKQCDLRTIDNTKSDCRYMPENVAGSIVVGADGYGRVAMTMTTPDPFSPTIFVPVCFYARIPAGVSVTISIYSNSGGSPDASLASATVLGTEPDINFNWYGDLVSTASLAAATQYWVVIEPTSASDNIDVAVGTSGYDTVAKSHDGAAWADISSSYVLYTTGVHRFPDADGISAGFLRFNGNLYHYADEGLFKYDSANEQFDSVGTILGTGDVTSAVVFGPHIYFARSSSVYTRMATDETFAASALTAKLFLEYKGLMYRAYQNDLYYSADGTTWTGPFAVGGNDVEIRGMAGMGDSLYLATDKALMRFAPGDVVEESTRFGAESVNNGVGMMEYMGRLYIPSAGRIFRFDPSGQMQDIWVSRENDLPETRLGRISALARMNNWLVAYVLPVVAGDRPTLWLWQEEGWHFLASAITVEQTAVGVYENCLYYDRGTSRLWFTWSGLWALYVVMDDYTLNPYNSSVSRYMPFGWIEQDKYYGGQYLLNKNFESVTIVGDISGSQNVTVYWQDEDSTDWERLGKATLDGQELRWDDPATRPVGRWIKLGLLLDSNLGYMTPRIRAVVVKFLPMVSDRIRDNLTITLSDYVQMPNGNRSTYTAMEMYAHLAGDDVIKAEGIVFYEDPLGVQYEVTVIDHNFIVTKYDYYNGAGHVEMRGVLVVEQVTTEPFIPEE